jgi:hypothetical protein
LRDGGVNPLDRPQAEKKGIEYDRLGHNGLERREAERFGENLARPVRLERTTLGSAKRRRGKQ